MSVQHPPRPPTRRGPLSDATARVNNACPTLPVSPTEKRPSIPHFQSPGLENLLPALDHLLITSNPRLSAITKEHKVHNPNRDSQVSSTSTNVSDSRKRKTHIGPWHLGKTLGKGSTARVRMARHAVTSQLAAIKIVQKKNAQLSQAGSLASLDRKDATLICHGEEFRRMPFGIEREVAIMKLIEHPHIMKLYDIWENRTEIYLVLEYVDNGELFEHISRRGCLPEKEAMTFFRQILSAVGYCHTFNICHRDLKPENILLTKSLTVKIADFGMAALHQTPEHRLQTSCGSPHYAAPEVIRASFYRGDKADIWSLGVILFASLAGYLPFDHESIPCLLEVIKSGRYNMAPSFSIEAADLIRRMLLVNPRDRLTISQIWNHPLLRKYDYLDKYGGGDNPRSIDLRTCERSLLRRSDIDRELLRHLRSLWHSFEEQQLIDLLLSNEPNDQKRFYGLLLKHREVQLENYVPDVFHSSSDYHHVRPLAQAKRLSTRQFSQPSSKSHRRQISRFTVVSNASRNRDGRRNSSYAETEAAETVKSYDPFKASRPQNFLTPQDIAYANITIYRGKASTQGSKATQEFGFSTAHSAGSRGKHQSLVLPPRVFVSRSSLASSGRSRGSASGIRVPKANKRGVSFMHIRKGSGASQRTPKGCLASRTEERHSEYTEVTDDGGDTLRAVTSPGGLKVQHKRFQSATSRPSSSTKRKDRGKSLLGEDLIQLSSSLGKVCDEAFNRTSVSPIPTILSSQEDSTDRNYNSPLSTKQNALRLRPTALRPSSLPVPKQVTNYKPWDTRPLPPPPKRSESITVELAKAREEAQLRKHSGEDSPGYLDRMVSHIDQLLQPISSPVRHGGDRRTASAPVAFRSHDVNRPLPSIHESNGEYASPIRQSAPRCTDKINSYDLDDRASRREKRIKETIRAIPPFSPPPAQPPAPLNIRKKSSRGPQPTTSKLGYELRPPAFDLRQQYSADPILKVKLAVRKSNENRSTEDPFSDGNSFHAVKKRKTNWFNRSSKSGDISEMGDANVTRLDRVIADSPALISKKKSFGFSRLFKKYGSKGDASSKNPTFEIYDDTGSIADSVEDPRRAAVGLNNYEDPRIRQIEPRQNWLARLFRVKPATGFICFSVSRRRARQEITSLLKEWRKYGARDVVVDRERNIIFARVGAKNYFNMKEVSFATEIMTIIEHGKRSHLSIARLTQERGAASSFYKVVDTLERALKSRGMLISDERKKRMMVKTINS